MSFIKPTVGRSLWLFLNGAMNLPHNVGDPLCAQIAAVYDDRRIAVGFLDANGEHHGMASVPLLQDGDTFPSGAYAVWMDYQKGEADKSGKPEKPAKRAEGSPTTGGMTPADPTMTAENIAGTKQSVNGVPEKSEAQMLAEAGSVGQPTTGGMTAANEDLPAPAAEAAKAVAKKEVVKVAAKVAAKTKAVAAKKSKTKH